MLYCFVTLRSSIQNYFIKTLINAAWFFKPFYVLATLYAWQPYMFGNISFHLSQVEIYLDEIRSEEVDGLYLLKKEDIPRLIGILTEAGLIRTVLAEIMAKKKLFSTCEFHVLFCNTKVFNTSEYYTHKKRKSFFY